MTIKTMLFGVGLAAAACTPALAQKGLDEPFQAAFKEALAGKTVAYIPVAMNFDLTEGWFAGVKKELEPYGMKVVVRDPNWSTNAGAQALTTLISEKPAAIIVHNPDVQTYAKLMQRAEAAADSAPCTMAILFDLTLQKLTTASVSRSPISIQFAPTKAELR